MDNEMIRTPREADFTAKQESNTDNIEKSYSKPSSSITSSTPCSSLKDPRIVRVSRAFGGKDRHSKVFTMKGLRDRRVRLSVPTAIQLYDLQERLGLNQPSKVVDWLLNAAKHDIDELPPLQMPIRNFDQDNDYQSSLPTSHGVLDSANEDGIMMINSASRESSYLNSNKSLEVNETNQITEKEHWNQRIEGEEEDVLRKKFFPRSSYSLCSHNSTYRWDPSILSLSHFRPQTDQDHHLHNFNVVQFPSVPLMSQLPSGSQVLVCPTGVTTQPYFPSHVGTDSADFVVPKQINHYQMLSSISQNPSFSNSMRPFQLSMAPSLFPSQNQSNNGDEFSPDEV